MENERDEREKGGCGAAEEEKTSSCIIFSAGNVNGIGDDDEKLEREKQVSNSMCGYSTSCRAAMSHAVI